MDILDLIKKEHRNIEALFSEIEQTGDTHKLYECFNELHQEISTHTEAKKITLYTAVRSCEDTEELVNKSQREQDEAKHLLEEIEFFSPTSSEFKAKIQQLKQVILQHVQEEENEMFSRVRQCIGEEERSKLATEFGAVKSKLQSETSAISS